MVLTVMWEDVLTVVGEDVRVIALVSSVSRVDAATHRSSPLLGLKSVCLRASQSCR